MSNNNYKNGSRNMEAHSTGSQITASVLILSVVLSFTLGLIGGYFYGEHRAETRISASAGLIVPGNTGNQGNQDSQNSQNNQVVESVDYSKYVINEKYNVTIDNFYADAESKQYASYLIGKAMPTFEWKTSDGTVEKTSDFGSGKYIVEIFSPTCTYCQSSIPVVDAFREANPDIPLVSLTTMDGDTAAFNEAGENAFRMDTVSNEANDVLNYIPWIPTFLYVENGEIQLVTFGGVMEGDFEDYMKVAFEQK